MEKRIDPRECKHYDVCTKRKGIWAGTYFICQLHKYCSDFIPKDNVKTIKEKIDDSGDDEDSGLFTTYEKSSF